MSVVGTAQEFVEGGTATQKLVGSGLTVRQVSEYTRVFRVKTNNVLDGPLVATGAPGLPAIGAAYTNQDLGGASVDVDSLATVKSITPRRSADSGKVWLVEILYSSDTGDPSRVEKDPTLRPPDVTWSANRQQKAVDKDLNGLPVVNSSSEKFDPPFQRDDTRLTLSISRNEAVFDPSIVLLYGDACNSDPFFGFGIGSWKVSSISAQSQFEQGMFFYRVTYTFEFNANGWAFTPLDQGANELVNGKLRGINDDRGGKLGVTTLNGGGRSLFSTGSYLSGSATTLTAAVAAADKTISVVDATVFGPIAVNEITFPPFDVKIDDEVMTVTSFLPNVSVLRGQRGTAAAAHANGATVQQQPFYFTFQVYPLLPFSVFGFNLR